MSGSGSLRLDHAVFLAWDVEATLTFYQDVLGLPLLTALSGERWGGFPWLMMVFGLDEGRHLAIVSLRGAPRPPADALPIDARHLALAAVEVNALSEWRRRLQGAGISFWEEDHDDQHSLYFADPNGITLEITAPPTGPVVADPVTARRVVDAFLRSEK